MLNCVAVTVEIKEKETVAVFPTASVTVNPTGKVPLCVGVPEIVEPLSERPVGSGPVVNAYVYVEVPPVSDEARLILTEAALEIF